MQKSKLESYEDVLEALVNKPLDLYQIAKKANAEPSILKQHIDFLIKSNLVEERPSGREVSYAVTERGIAVLKALSFQKYLGKIKDKIGAIEEALQVIPDISERVQRLDKKKTS